MIFLQVVGFESSSWNNFGNYLCLFRKIHKQIVISVGWKTFLLKSQNWDARLITQRSTIKFKKVNFIFLHNFAQNLYFLMLSLYVERHFLKKSTYGLLFPSRLNLFLYQQLFGEIMSSDFFLSLIIGVLLWHHLIWELVRC